MLTKANVAVHLHQSVDFPEAMIRLPHMFPKITQSFKPKP